jgi:tRNA nucleotidyltransferase (CCA-adding enzyme)
MRTIDEVIEAVRGRVVPRANEKVEMREAANRAKADIEKQFKGSKYPVDVLIEGSIAKDTWIKGETDVDIFVRFPPDYVKEEIAGVTISAAKTVFGEDKCFERYAEHPFVTVHLRGLMLDIVPCYRSEPGAWMSATDRTPYHTEFVQSHLSQDEKDEARLLKRFAKGIGAYGAEIKVGGFSGLLCELLAHHYGSFRRTIEAMASLKLPLLIDPINHYGGRDAEALGVFGSEFTVVDPVDERRNVAAAVTRTKLSEMMAAAVAFINRPSSAFFFPTRRALGPRQLKAIIRNERRQLLAIELGAMNVPPDIFWGQLYSARDKIANILRSGEFKVVRIMGWSDERACSFVIAELESRTLSPSRERAGPPVNSPHTRRYMEIYGSGDGVVGPWIRDERFFITTRRRHTDAATYLRGAVRECARTGGMPTLIAQHLARGVRVLVDGQIPILAKSREAAIFITEFIDGRPIWMKGAYGRAMN